MATRKAAAGSKTAKAGASVKRGRKASAAPNVPGVSESLAKPLDKDDLSALRHGTGIVIDAHVGVDAAHLIVEKQFELKGGPWQVPEGEAQKVKRTIPIASRGDAGIPSHFPPEGTHLRAGGDDELIVQTLGRALKANDQLTVAWRHGALITHAVLLVRRVNRSDVVEQHAYPLGAMINPPSIKDAPSLKKTAKVGDGGDCGSEVPEAPHGPLAEPEVPHDLSREAGALD